MSIRAKRFAFTTGLVSLLLFGGIVGALILTRNAAEPDDLECPCSPYDLIVLLLDDPGPMVMCEEAFVWGESYDIDYWGGVSCDYADIDCGGGDCACLHEWIVIHVESQEIVAEGGGPGYPIYFTPMRAGLHKFEMTAKDHYPYPLPPSCGGCGPESTTETKYGYVSCPEFEVRLSKNELSACACGDEEIYASAEPGACVPFEWSLKGNSNGLFIDPQRGIIRKADPTRELTPAVVTVMATLRDSPECYATAELRIEDCESCASGDCGAGKGGMDLDGIDARFKMGKAADGESVGHVWIHASIPSGRLATPAGLSYNVHLDDVTVIRDNEDALRQVLAPEALADIVVDDDYSYRIDFYTAADAGELVEGLYVPTGDPFVTWLIENPDGASGNKGSRRNNLNDCA